MSNSATVTVPATNNANRYKLINGQHNEPVPGFTGRMDDPNRVRKYLQGSVIESDRDLVSIFPNKFMLMSEDDLAPAVDMDKRRSAVTAMIDSGNWTDEDRHFLEHLSDKNFERITARFSGAVTASTVENRTISTLGEDVTSKFGRAYDSEFKVFKNAKNKHQVTTKTEVERPLNKEPLDGKDVEKFVDMYLKERR